MSSDNQPGRVTLQLLGLTTECWNCGSNTIALVGILPINSDESNFVQLNDPAALAFAAELLPKYSPRVGVIKNRASRTAGETYFSNGCVDCDALLGNVFLFHEELLEILVVEGVAGLEVVATVTAPGEQWGAVAPASGHGRSDR